VGLGLRPHRPRVAEPRAGHELTVVQAAARPRGTEGYLRNWST
jgi:hypothetical protein